MNPFALEHGQAAFHADVAFYAAAVLLLVAFLARSGPQVPGAAIAAVSLSGLAAWTLAEYLLHRFVLHGLDPFRRWHLLHHARPDALIYTPTILGASVFAFLVFLPAAAVAGWWPAEALTLGLLVGYLAYTITHHRAHHAHERNRWLARRKRWHAIHHHADRPVCFGVTSGFWDRVFGTAGPAGRPTP